MPERGVSKGRSSRVAGPPRLPARSEVRPPFAQRGTFAIGTNAALGVDGVSEADGLDLSAANLGRPYAEGVLVVQDGHKRLPHGPQNFKLVPWAAVERAVLQR